MAANNKVSDPLTKAVWNVEKAARHCGPGLCKILARLSTVLLVGVLLASACTSTSKKEAVGDTTESEVFVGEIDGGKALIAIVTDAESVTVYTCGFDESLRTHTGWFFGGTQGQGTSRTMPTLSSAGGLALDGTITSGAAEGTLKLISGQVVPWKATKAQNGAGLYHADDIVALTGLVVNNDGRMAGNAKLKTSSTPVGGSPAPAQSVAVSVPGGPPRSPTPVTTNFPVGPVVRTIPVTPVRTSKAIVKNGPKLVFLVHGMSDSLTTGATSNDSVKCEGPKDTPFYSRCEWGVDFIPGLFGIGTAASGSLFNLAGNDMSADRYLSDPGEPINENLGITARDANGCVTDPRETGSNEPDPKIAAHFITAGRPVPGVRPQTAVFTTWRDSTRGMVESGRRVANQVYAALKWYEKTYPGEAPALYFVAQSFGGLATRFLVSNPAPETFNNPVTNADRIFVCPEDRGKMDYLRDRTVLVSTLATPHEGSYLAELGQPAKDYLTAALRDLQGGTNELAQVLRVLDPLLFRTNLVDVANAEITRLLRLLDTPALRDLTFATMAAFNRGPLAPERAVRTLASPIVGAQGALIPIYATVARSPGSTSFDSPDVLNLATFDEQTVKEKGWIVATIVTDVVIRQVLHDGQGRVDVAPYTEHAAVLDRRKRLFDLSTTLNAAKTTVAAAAADIVGDLSPYFAGEFGAGAEGIFKYFQSSNVKILPNAMIPIYIDREWKINLSGTQQVPMLKLTCAGQEVLLDYDPLVRAVLLTYGTTTAAAAALATLNLGQLFQLLGTVVPNLTEMADGTIRWLSAKVRQLERTPDECKIGPIAEEAVADPLAFYKALGWKAEATTGPVPAPAWFRTDIPVRDNEMDADGPVHAASALGLTLGRQPFFFEHDRMDGPVRNGTATSGSWYRLADNPVTEQYNHGLQYQNDVGRWVKTRLFAPTVGPLPGPGPDSRWP